MNSYDARRIAIIFSALFVLASVMIALDEPLLGSDNADHGLAGVFAYDFIEYIASNAFSGIDIVGFVGEHHAHYKSLAGLTLYPPLHTVLVAASFVIGGRNLFMAKVPNLIFGGLTVYFTYLLASLIFEKHRKRDLISLLAALVVATNPFFAESARSIHLDIGLAFFSVSAIYYLIKYIKEGERNDIILATVLVGLGILEKQPMFLIGPAMAYGVFVKAKLRDMKMVKTLTLVFMLTISPWLLTSGTLLATGNYNFGRWDNIMGFVDLDIYGDEHVDGFVSIERYTDLGGHKMIDPSVPQRLGLITSVLAYNTILIPFMLLGLYLSYKAKRFSGPIAIYVGTIYFMHSIVSHIEPRYMIPILPFMSIFLAEGILTFFRGRAGKLLVLFLILTTAFRPVNFASISEPESPDQDVVKFVVEDDAGGYVVTTRLRVHSYLFSIYDRDRKFYILEEWSPDADAFFELVDGEYKGSTWDRLGIEAKPARHVIVTHRYLDRFEDASALTSGLAERGFELRKVFNENENSEIRVYRRA